MLRILGWDNPRCMAPMRAATEHYRELHPHVNFSLTARPLASFNDQPIEALPGEADVVVFDHPMVPQAAAAASLLALDVVADELRTPLVCPETVGASGDSYDWNGHTWGLAVDAACQVAAARVEVFEQLGVEVPMTWDQVLALAAEHPSRVALPLYPSDAFCALLSISAALAPGGVERGWLALGAF
jgi:multiple sugar transport system substrate-binding protein